MKIRMSDINSEGKKFTFDRVSGELNEILADLTQKAYKVNVFIRDLDAYFELSGEVRADVPQVCSKCGEDISLPIVKKFNDMLMEKPVDPRGSHYSKGMSVDASEQLPGEVAFYSNDLFDLGEYIHELLALEMPDYPDCAVQECPFLKEAQAKLASLNAESGDFKVSEGHPAFKALKNIKLN